MSLPATMDPGPAPDLIRGRVRDDYLQYGRGVNPAMTDGSPRLGHPDPRKFVTGGYSVRLGTRISRWPLPLMALTRPAFSMSSTSRAARL